MSKPLQIHLGCGRHRIPGWVNCDLYPTEATDVLFNVQGAWPFQDNSASLIYTSHMVEHLPDFHAFFREAYRVLLPDGVLQVRVPFGNHHAAWWDVSHVRPWFAESFCFLQPGYGYSVNNAQHREWESYFSVEDVVLRVPAQMCRYLRWKVGRMVLVPWLDKLNNVVEEMWVYLVALKGEQRIDEWLKMRSPTGVPARYAAFKYHWEQRQQRPDEPLDFVTIARGCDQ